MFWWREQDICLENKSVCYDYWDFLTNFLTCFLTPLFDAVQNFSYYLLWIQPNWKYLEFLKENNDYLYGDLKLVFVQVWDIHFIGSGFSLWLLVWENFSIFYHQLLEIASTFLLYNFLGYAETAAMTSSNMQGRLVTWFFNFQLCVTLRELVKEWVSDSRSSFYQMLLISPI